MKTFKLLHLFLLMAFISETNITNAQIKATFFKNMRNDAGISYNFFTGADAVDFSTTIKGFGSGFIFDIFSGRYSFDFVTLGSKKVNLSLGAGIAITKYRFSDNLVINTSNDSLFYESDIPGRDYGSGFFSYGKSKLVYGSVYLPLNFNIYFKEVSFSAGILLDQYLSGKLKRKYKEDGSKKSEVIRNNDFNDFFLNKTKYGVNASIKHKKSGIGLGFNYMFTPFFKEDKGPVLNETRISITFDLKKKAEEKLKERKTGEINT